MAALNGQLGLWPVRHPDRPCYTCGSLPTGRFRDGSPSYSCGPHPPIRAEHDALDWTHYGSVEWTLTEDEMERSAERARMVIEMDRRRGWQHKFTPRNESEQDVNTRGFAAELAASHVTGLELHWEILSDEYRRENKKAHPDIGTKVEVRSAWRPNGRLVGRPGDPPDWYYLLVTGPGPRFTVRGWLAGKELMVPEHWEEEPPPAWMAKQADLKPLPLPPDA